jgi:hypothetical protein
VSEAAVNALVPFPANYPLRSIDNDQHLWGDGIAWPATIPLTSAGMPLPAPVPRPEPVLRRGSLHFVIGVQRSGKSTYCTRWAQRLEWPDGGESFPRAIVCDDELRLAIHGRRWVRDAEPLVYGLEPYFIRALLNRHDVIVDETHTTERSILKVLAIDPDATWHLVDTPLDTCIRRAYETDQADLIGPIKRCHAQLEALKAYGIEKKIDELRIIARDRNS